MSCALASLETTFFGMRLYLFSRCLTKCFFLLASQLLFRLACSSSLRSPPLSLNEIRGFSTAAAQKGIDRRSDGKHKCKGESHNLAMRYLILGLQEFGRVLTGAVAREIALQSLLD